MALDFMSESLSTLYGSSMKAPTTLIELTDREHKRLQNNCIHVSGIKQITGVPNGSNNKKGKCTIEYSKVTYGSSLSVSRIRANYGEEMWYKRVNLNKTPKISC